MGFAGIIGHEFVGVVEEVVPAEEGRDEFAHLVGKRVVGEINLGAFMVRYVNRMCFGRPAGRRTYARKEVSRSSERLEHCSFVCRPGISVPTHGELSLVVRHE